LARKIGSRYTAHQVLGRGSAGTVWLGEGPDGPVAIKLLREDLASDQDLVGRFVQERTALLSLDHPHIVGIRDLVVDGTDLALVMDLVRGTDLRSRLERERRFAPEAAVAMAADVADALAAAHAAGVVHRDVKPENVLLDSAAPAGQGAAAPALLTDFGIARLVDAPRRTRATRIIGTPDYLAPEIIEGLPPRASVDIYALATVLYELIAGFTPFGGGHPGAVLRRHVTETVAPLPELPDALWQLLAQCLAKAPASRLTAGELGERLRALLPQLRGLPAIDTEAPGTGEDDHHGHHDRDHRETHDRDHRENHDSDPGEHRSADQAYVGPYEPEGPRRGAARPLVRGAAPDSTRDTHTSIKLPTAEELAARPAAPRHRRRAPASSDRRKRVRLGVAAAAALVVAGLGGWGIVAGTGDDDEGGTSPARNSDPSPDTSPRGTPTAPTAGATSQQGTVNTRTQTTARWSAFNSLPTPPGGIRLTDGPRAVTFAGTTYVFARGADKNLWYFDGESWRRLTGISVLGDPAVVSSRAGQLDVFSLGTDHLLYRRTMTAGTWSGWYPVDERTKFDSAPAAASSEPGRIDLVGRVGGDLLTASFAGDRWNAWALVPTAGRITSDPGLISRRGGTLDAFVVRKADGAVLRLPYAGAAWRPNQAVTGLDATGRPEPVLADGRLYVFAPTASGLAEAAEAAKPDGGWSTHNLPADTVSGVAVTSLGQDITLWLRSASGGFLQSSAVTGQ
jgi:serine/threonine protein kinase